MPVLGEQSKKELSGPRSHVVQETDRKPDDIQVQVQVIEARNLPSSILHKPNPYVGIYVLKDTFPRCTTEKATKTNTPKWKQTLELFVANWKKTRRPMSIRCEVYDWNKSDEHDFLGEATIQFNEYAALKETTGKWVEVWLPLAKRTSKDKVSGDIHVAIRCIDVEEKEKKQTKKEVEDNATPPIEISAPIQPTFPTGVNSSNKENEIIDEDDLEIDAEGEGLRDGLKEGEVAPVYVFAKKKDGKPVNLKNLGPIEAFVTAPNYNSKSDPKPCKVNFRDDGSAAFDMKSFEGPGTYLVDIKVKGKPIRYSPYPVVVHPEASSNDSLAYGDCLYHPEQKTKPYKACIVETPNEFYVQVKDSNGHDILDGGDRINIEVKNGALLVREPVDNQNGTYTVPFTPLKTGICELEVILNGLPISNSPVKLLVEDKTDPSKTIVDDLQTTIKCKQPQQFSIIACDSSGNKRERGGDIVEVSFENNDSATIFTDDNNTGTYEVTYTCPIPGEFKLIAKLNGVPVVQSPIKVIPTVDANYCTIIDHKLVHGGDLSASKDLSLQFSFQTRDNEGQLVTQSCGEKITADITYYKDLSKKNGTSIGVANVVDNSDGTYTIQHSPKEAGVYQFDIFLQNSLLPFSPFDLIVTDGVDASNSEFLGPQKAYVDTPTKLLIRPKDLNGVNVVAPIDAQFDIEISDSNGNPVDDITPLPPREDGIRPYQFTPKTKGIHKVTAKYNDEPIQNSPFQLHAKEKVWRPDPTKCEIAKLPEESNAHQPVLFDIQLKTDENKPLIFGGEDLEVSVSLDDCPSHKQPYTPVKFEVKPNGVRPCQFKPLVPGVYSVDARVNGVPIANSPKRIKVLPPNPYSAKVTNRSFQIQIYDDQGEKYTNMDEEEIQSVKVDFLEKETKQHTENIKSNIKYLGEGLFLVQYLVIKQGDYEMIVNVEGQLVAKVNYQFENFEFKEE
ncbi:hypothetical protein ABK040_015515 [Willaertia magna]